VTIRAESDNTLEGEVTGQSRVQDLVFSAQNWSQPKTVIVTGVDDDPPAEDGTVAYDVDLTVITTDGKYAALGALPSVGLLNEDNDLSDLSIAGNVIYGGPQQGPIKVQAFLAGRPDPEPVAEDVLGVPGPYLLFPLAAGQYTVSAFRDSNDNGVKDLDEAEGSYDGSRAAGVDVPPSATGININMTDPDLDGNEIPDWWENDNFGANGVDPEGDADNDGRGNKQEFEEGTDPNGWRVGMGSGGRDLPTLRFGMKVGADDGGADEWDVPVSGTWDMDIFFDTDGGLHEDIRAVTENDVVWNLVARPTNGRDIVELAWNAADIPPRHAVLIQEVDAAGDPVPGGTMLDMGRADAPRKIELDTTQTRYFQIRYISRATQEITLDEGWTLVSLWVHPDQPVVNPEEPGGVGVFQDENHGDVFGWNGTHYVRLVTVGPLMGIWVYREPGSGQAVIQVTGIPLVYADKQVPLEDGWNMYGIGDSPLQFTGAGVFGTAYSWNGAYIVIPPGADLTKGEAYLLFRAGGPLPWDTSLYR
jgi:hypothetical protein